MKLKKLLKVIAIELKNEKYFVIQEIDTLEYIYKEDIKEARTFKSKRKAKNFIVQNYLDKREYKIIDKREVI